MTALAARVGPGLSRRVEGFRSIAQRTAFEPWTVQDVVNVSVLFAASALIVVGGWYGASGEGRVDDQTVWISVAAGGVMLAGVAVAVWTAAARRAIEQRRRVLVEEVRAVLAAAPVRPGDPSVPNGDRRTRPRFVAATSMTKYHRPDCPLVDGKTARSGTRRHHERSGRAPCGVCSPDADGVEWQTDGLRSREET